MLGFVLTRISDGLQPLQQDGKAWLINSPSLDGKIESLMITLGAHLRRKMPCRQSWLKTPCRFLELLEARLAADRPALDASGLRATFAEMLTLLEAQSGRIELSLPLFVRKIAPVSQVQSLMDYDLSIAVDGGARDAITTLTVLVPCTSLCPCSKTISDYGAHNQRSHVTVAVETESAIEPEDLIALVESQASSELYGLLKRVDEKHVTERAYDNPKFVEDLVRDVAVALRGDARVRRFVVEAENFESIHNHSAYARLEG